MSIKNNVFKLIVIFSLFLLFGISSASAEEYVDIQIYNRNENVELTEPMLYRNGKYFISVEDLEKINLDYSITEESDGDYRINVHSTDAYGIENILDISATIQKSSSVDISTGEVVITDKISYRFKNSVTLKKELIGDYSGIQSNTYFYGTQKSALFEDNKYYVSLEIIGEVLSHLYLVENNKIYLWVTDEEHAIINGKIVMRDNDVAPMGGLDVDFTVYTEDIDSQKHYTENTYTIAENENSAEYFTEIYIPDNSNCYIYATVEFADDYKVIRKWCKIDRAGKWIFDADANEDKLAVLVDFPVEVTANFSNNEMFLENISSKNINGAVLYCAFFEDDTLVDVMIKSIEWIGAYEGIQRAGVKLSANNSEYSEIKLYLWDINMKPLSKVYLEQFDNRNF